jgi:hypothetical protein
VDDTPCQILGHALAIFNKSVRRMGRKSDGKICHQFDFANLSGGLLQLWLGSFRPGSGGNLAEIDGIELIFLLMRASILSSPFKRQELMNSVVHSVPSLKLKPLGSLGALQIKASANVLKPLGSDLPYAFENCSKCPSNGPPNASYAFCATETWE